jgi:biopolymer transport protein ExbD
MITRPLDLAARLRSAPRSLDALFWVNVGVVVMFFAVFGSRFVLAPGVGVDFSLSQFQGATHGAARTTHVISVARSGLIFTDKGALNFDQLKQWLSEQGGKTQSPVLLVRADAAIPVADLTDITSVAQQAGFQVQIAALEPRIPVAGSR